MTMTNPNAGSYTIKSNAQGMHTAPYFTSSSLTVAAPGWFIVGKPTLRQLLRYWWKSRSRRRSDG
jgi:hypothetical protein